MINLEHPSLSSNPAALAAKKIQSLLPSFKVDIGVVAGTGLGSFIDHLENPVVVPYQDLPGFPEVAVKGHQNNLVLGTLNGVNVAFLQGRAHSYEGPNQEAVKTYVRTLHLLGAEYFIATNAAGSLREDAAPGSLMLITDHINLQPNNPLVGPNDDAFGPRFYPLDNAYDARMRKQLLHIARDEKIELHQGVYISVLGPHYETAAEIRAFRVLGADAVGMSTVPEVLVANHCGMKVAVISAISNYATGLNTSAHDHDAVVLMAANAAQNMNKLLKKYIAGLKTPT